MADAVNTSSGSNKPFALPGKPFTPEDEAALKRVGSSLLIEELALYGS